MKTKKTVKTTGKYSYKSYICSKCSTQKSIGTNHWGDCYPYCFKCREQTAWICLDPAPPGVGKPEKWKQAKLGDVVDIVRGGKK
jgi:hypothetical protein